MRRHTKKLTLLGLLTAIALILSYVEALLPPIFVAVPGIKMGLPNIAIIFVLYRFGLKEAAAVSLVRLAAVALLFGNAMTLIYSFAGAVLSLTLMSLLKRSNLFSMIGVSIVGGVSHNLGQILVAMWLMETVEIGYYMIILTVTGTIAGILIGLAGSFVLKYLNNLNI
jgi:heptaprenyl diphosphate synthase